MYFEVDPLDCFTGTQSEQSDIIFCGFVLDRLYEFVSIGKIIIMCIFSFVHQINIKSNDKLIAVEAQILLMVARFSAKREGFRFIWVYFVASYIATLGWNWNIID